MAKMEIPIGLRREARDNSTAIFIARYIVFYYIGDEILKGRCTLKRDYDNKTETLANLLAEDSN